MPFEGDDSLAKELILETWSKPGEHWSFRENGAGEFKTYIGHPHFPFTYEYKWSIENSEILIEYEEGIVEPKAFKGGSYKILELTAKTLVLKPVSKGRTIALSVYDF